MTDGQTLAWTGLVVAFIIGAFTLLIVCARGGA
jgi:hypothetical protein